MTRTEIREFTARDRKGMPVVVSIERKLKPRPRTEKSAVTKTLKGWKKSTGKAKVHPAVMQKMKAAYLGTAPRDRQGRFLKTMD
jgi:hypothetical protein